MQSRISVYGLYPEFLNWDNEKKFLDAYQAFLATKDPGDVRLIPLLVQARHDQRLEEIIRQDLAACLPAEKDVLLKTLALPYAVDMLNEGIFPPHAELDFYAIRWLKERTMCLGAEDSFVNFYYEYGNRLTADELMILQKFVNPENVKLADNIDYRLHNSHLMVVEKGVKRQAWLEGDEKLLQLITGNSLAVNNLKDDADLESAGSFSSLASESFIDVDLSDNVPNQLDESSIISLLKEYLKQALYKANNPPAGEYSVIMNFFHHSKESKTKVEEAIIALENTSKASLAIQIVIDLLKRHETPGSGLHTNSVDTYFLQFMYAEGSINNKFSKGLILFSVEDLKKYRFIPPNEDGFDCNGRVARSLRGKDRLPDAIAREAYRLGAINALLKIMSFICQIGAKQQPQNPEITYRQTSTL